MIGVVAPFFTSASVLERLRGVVGQLRERGDYDLVLFDVESLPQRENAFREFARTDRVDGLLVMSLRPTDWRSRTSAGRSFRSCSLTSVIRPSRAWSSTTCAVARWQPSTCSKGAHEDRLRRRRTDPIRLHLERAASRGNGPRAGPRGNHSGRGPRAARDARSRAGARLGRGLLALPDRPTAVFAASDVQAMGVLDLPGPGASACPRTWPSSASTTSRWPRCSGSRPSASRCARPAPEAPSSCLGRGGGVKWVESSRRSRRSAPHDVVISRSCSRSRTGLAACGPPTTTGRFDFEPLLGPPLTTRPAAGSRRSRSRRRSTCSRAAASPRAPEPAVACGSRCSPMPAGVRGARWDERDQSANLSLADRAGRNGTRSSSRRSEACSRPRRGAMVLIFLARPSTSPQPYGGRHLECLSEDPPLTARIGSATCSHPQGAASAATVKRFIANTSETERMTPSMFGSTSGRWASSTLAPFEAIVRDAGVWSVHGVVRRRHRAAGGRERSFSRRPPGGLASTAWRCPDWFATRSTEASGRAGARSGDAGARTARGATRFSARSAPRRSTSRRSTTRCYGLLRLAARVGALDGTAPTPLA